MSRRIIRPALALAAVAGLAACSSYGDRGYGYSRVSLGAGYNSPYYGWYDGFYYPGAGYYIYDRSGGRHRWDDRQRRYWESRRGDYRGHGNWSGYGHGRPGYAHDGHRDHDRDRWQGHRGGNDGRHDSSREHRNHDRNEWRRNNNRRDRR